MLLIKQLKVFVSENPEEELKKKIKKELKISDDDILDIEILRQSVDARKKSELFFVYNVAIRLRKSEDVFLKRKFKFDIEKYNPLSYKIPLVKKYILKKIDDKYVIEEDEKYDSK